MSTLNPDERKKKVASLIAEQKALIEEHWGQQALINAYLSTERIAEIQSRMDALAEQHRLIGKEIQQLVFAPKSAGV